MVAAWSRCRALVSRHSRAPIVKARYRSMIIVDSRKPIHIWWALMSAAIFAEGAWFFVAFNLSRMSVPGKFVVLFALWVFLALSAIFAFRHPLVCLIAACSNFLGCGLIKTVPPTISHPLAYFLYLHSVDILIIVCAFFFVRSKQKSLLHSQGM